MNNNKDSKNQCKQKSIDNFIALMSLWYAELLLYLESKDTLKKIEPYKALVLEIVM